MADTNIKSRLYCWNDLMFVRFVMTSFMIAVYLWLLSLIHVNSSTKHYLIVLFSAENKLSNLKRWIRRDNKRNFHFSSQKKNLCSAFFFFQFFCEICNDCAQLRIVRLRKKWVMRHSMTLQSWWVMIVNDWNSGACREISWEGMEYFSGKLIIIGMADFFSD